MSKLFYVIRIAKKNYQEKTLYDASKSGTAANTTHFVKKQGVEQLVSHKKLKKFYSQFVCHVSKQVLDLILLLYPKSFEKSQVKMVKSNFWEVNGSAQHR